MPEAFPYLLRRREAGEPAGRAVEESYGLADLAARPVVRDEASGLYQVFESRADFLRWYAALPAEGRACHEVIFGAAPQRLKFDVDAPADRLAPLVDPGAAAAAAAAEAELEALLGPGAYAEAAAEAAAAAAAGGAGPPAPEREAAERVVDALLEAILDELHEGFLGVEDLAPTRACLAVTESGGPTPGGGWKFSYHVLVLPYAVANCLEAQGFTEGVLARLPAEARPFVDPGVNRRTQCFRLAGSAKPGTGRVKAATPGAARRFGTARGLGVADLFVTAAPGDRVLRRAYSAPGAEPGGPPPLGPQDAPVAAALALADAAGVLEGHAFAGARGALLTFRRTAPSFCALCAETHHRDNSLLLSLAPAGGAWEGAAAAQVFERCRQRRGAARLLGEVPLGDAPRREGGAAAAAALFRRPPGGRPAADAPTLAALVADRLARIADGRVDPRAAVASGFEALPPARRTEYSAPEMREYGLHPTLVVCAQMGVGKTKALKALMDAHFAEGGLEGPPVRVFVTFRQTFGAEVARKFPGAALYSDLVGELDPAVHPFLVVQTESLHRLRPPTAGGAPPPDLVVLDEVESILAQFNSGLHQHFAAAFAAFQWLVASARHVVCMDANVSDRTLRFLERARPRAPPHFHWNRFERAAGDSFLFTADQGAWLEALYARLRAGERVVLPTNSLAEAKACEAAIRREFPRKAVRLYSSETAPSEKALHFGDVHTHWGGLDVLIYTPTCSAGVSFELPHFDVLFAFFSDASCDVETCRQMLGRVRALRTREHVVCLRGTRACLPTELADLRRLVYDSRAGLFRGVDGAALRWAYEAPEGGGPPTVRFYESDYFHLWLDTVRIENLSRNRFVERFIDQVASTGARLSLLGGASGAGAALLLRHREVHADLRQAHAEAVADAADLGPRAAAEAAEALRAQEDVPPPLRLALEKFNLRAAYGWEGRPLDADFVARYSPEGARRVFRALRRIGAGPSADASLELLRRHEADFYGAVMASRSAACEGRDILRGRSFYVHEAHRLAVLLLRACGWEVGDRDARRAADASLLEARLRAALPALRPLLPKFVFEFEVRRPDLDRLAAEADPGRFLSGFLRFVNSVIGPFYGLRVHRLPKREGGGGRAYTLSPNAVGKLFSFGGAEAADPPGREGARPHVLSALEPGAAADPLETDAALFLARAFFAAPPALAPGPPPDAGDAADPAAGAAADPAADPDDAALAAWLDGFAPARPADGGFNLPEGELGDAFDPLDVADFLERISRGRR